MAYMLNNIENNKIYLFFKNKFNINLNKNKDMEFCEDSRIPELIDEVVSKRAELNNLILDIGIFSSMLEKTEVAESLYKAFSYDELEGNSEEEWEAQLTQEIESYPERKLELETKIRLLEREIQGTNNSRF